MSKRRSKNNRSAEQRSPAKATHGAAGVLAFPSGRRVPVGELGVFDRSYPPKGERKRAIDGIKAIPEDRRSPEQWWMLGEYLVYDGLLEESEAVTNEGIGALMKGASLPSARINPEKGDENVI